MKAAICYDFNGPLSVEEVTLDPPQTGEVKVKLAACAICHSDVHLIRGEWGGEPPVIAGHEAAGVVAELGPGVTSVQPGDHVVVSLLRQCGHCFQCTIGKPFNCDTPMPLDTECRFHNSRGEPIRHGIKTAAFADYTIVDQSQLVVVPPELPLDAMALLACGVITGLGAVVNTASIEPGASVAVLGAGGVGLNAVQGAALAGARRVIAVDLLDLKLEAARDFGATHTVNSSQADAVQAVMDLTDGYGVDYAFVTVGSTAAMNQAFAMTRKAGTTVIVGIPPTNANTLSFNSGHFISERRVMGSPMGSTRLRVHVPQLVELYQQQRLKLDELITRRYPLEQINQAIASMEAGEALRNVIIFEG